MKRIIILLLVVIPIALSAQEQLASAYFCPPCNSNCDEIEFEKAGSCHHCGMELIKQTKEERAKQMSSQKTIAFYLQSGVEVLDFAGPMEVFAYAGYEVFTVSKTKDPIISQGILTIIPDYSIKDAPEADILAFFGGNSGAASGDKEVIDWVKNQSPEYYFSVCTGAFVLAEAGVLDGQTVTTFHESIPSLESRYPKAKVLKDARYVDNGNIITTAGVSAGIDGALHLVAKLQGLLLAERAAFYMEYDKWSPGQGVILDENNPYDGYEIPNWNYLNEISGTYEYPDGKQVEIIVSKSSNRLTAIIENDPSHLFYQSPDRLINSGNEEVEMIRENGKVVGYKIAQNDKLFKKLK